MTLTPRNALLALALLGLATPAFAQDSDADGVPDAADAFPCDASMSAIQFAPSAGAWSLLLFEDQWPDDSDLDFNDVAVRVHYRLYRDAQGRVVRVNASFDPLAVGGALTNGLGLQLPASRTSATVRRRVAQGAWETLAFESDANATVIVSPNLRELFDGVEGPINASPDEPRRTGQQIELEISFALPVTINGALAPFDVFIFRADDLGHQIHLPRYRGTEAMNTALFNAGIDGTTPDRAFVDRQGLPFALDLATSSRYPHEGEPISSLFPDIVGFAASGGALNTSFYVSNVATEYGHDISALALPEEPAASTACVLLAISPSAVTLAPGSTRVFTASSGTPPYVFSVVSGGGSFSGSTYTAPSSGSTAVVRVTDGAGATAQATVTLTLGTVSFTTAGAFSWTVPPGVTSIHAVVVGGGGGGAMLGGPVTATNYGGAASGGAGGGLSYRNSISVTPGQVLTITVGAAGTAGSGYSGSVDGGNGGTSQIAGLLSATGGAGGRVNNALPAGGSGSGGTANRTGGAGGVGSASGSPGGGGGAAGYTGNGGAAATTNGSNGSAGLGGGGGGGSGGFPGNGYGGGAGGGVGLLGVGSNGAGGVFVAANAGSSSTASGGGGGGSAGASGAASGTGGGGVGGAYGGGGSSGRKHPSVMTGWAARPGGGGAVRIIWGAGRSFPSSAN